MHNFDTYFHPLGSIVLKLFDDKYKTKTCESLHNHISWIAFQGIIFFHAVIVTFFKGQIVTLQTVMLLIMIFHSPLKMKNQNTKVCLLK